MTDAEDRLEGKTDADGRFTEKTLEEINAVRAQVEEQYQALLIGYTTYDFSSDRAKEFATHAFARRLKLLRRCIDNVFRLVPPNSDVPSDCDLQDATIHIHAFYSNLFGAMASVAFRFSPNGRYRVDDPRLGPRRPTVFG